MVSLHEPNEGHQLVDMLFLKEGGRRGVRDGQIEGERGGEPTDTSKQPIRTLYFKGHVTGYQPIRDRYFLIRSVPKSCNIFQRQVQYDKWSLELGVPCP
eukprot:sb/3478719/